MLWTVAQELELSPDTVCKAVETLLGRMAKQQEEGAKDGN